MPIQACLQGLVFGCELVLYFLVSVHITNQWIRFALTTCAWQMVHALDGLVNIFSPPRKKTVNFQHYYSLLQPRIPQTRLKSIPSCDRHGYILLSKLIKNQYRIVPFRDKRSAEISIRNFPKIGGSDRRKIHCKG